MCLPIYLSAGTTSRAAFNERALDSQAMCVTLNLTCGVSVNLQVLGRPVGLVQGRRGHAAASVEVLDREGASESKRVGGGGGHIARTHTVSRARAHTHTHIPVLTLCLCLCGAGAAEARDRALLEPRVPRSFRCRLRQLRLYETGESRHREARTEGKEWGKGGGRGRVGGGE